jgi:hypothetical protein
MLALQEHAVAANTSHEQTSLPCQIDAMDHQLNRLVYQLYELTAEDIRIVENIHR